jgi:hypothetical protein
MILKKGWIESRKTKVSAVMVDYRVLTAEEMARLKKESQYSRTTLQIPDLARMMAHFFHTTSEELLAGRLVFCSQELLKPGLHLEAQTHIADFNCSLHFLAETHAVGLEAEMKETVFSSGIIIVAVHKGDMDFLSGVIESRKKKQEEG